LPGRASPLVRADQLTPQQRQQSHLILAGEYSGNSVLREVLDARGRNAPLASASAFQQQQGYFIGVYPGQFAAGKRVIAAAGWSPQGALYAVSHLRTPLPGRSAKSLPSTWRAPAVPAPPRPIERTEKPDVADRGIYYNIGIYTSFDNLTPDTFDESEWAAWLDKHVCAQLTTVNFYLWGNVELYFPKTAFGRAALRKGLAERLQYMIGEAHRRGLKATFCFTPTLLPEDIIQANIPALPNLKSSSVYAQSSTGVVCQAEPGTISHEGNTWNGCMDLMRDVYSYALSTFREADQYMIFFYDAGGCWCPPLQIRLPQSATSTPHAAKLHDLRAHAAVQSAVQVHCPHAAHLGAGRLGIHRLALPRCLLHAAQGLLRRQAG
jgi:hypothetical protein